MTLWWILSVSLQFGIDGVDCGRFSGLSFSKNQSIREVMAEGFHMVINTYQYKARCSAM